MTAREREVAQIQCSIDNRYRLTMEAIEAKDSEKAAEHSSWLAFCGIQMLAHKSGVVGFHIYDQIQDWWAGGQP